MSTEKPRKPPNARFLQIYPLKNIKRKYIAIKQLSSYIIHQNILTFSEKLRFSNRVHVLLIESMFY